MVPAAAVNLSQGSTVTWILSSNPYNLINRALVKLLSLFTGAEIKADIVHGDKTTTE